MRRPLLLFVATALAMALQAHDRTGTRYISKPGDPYAVGEQADRRGGHQQSVRQFTYTIKTAPASLNAFLDKAFCLSNLMRHAEATIAPAVVSDREPTDVLAYTTRGGSYLKAGQPELALAELKKVISLDTRNEDSRNHLVCARKATGDMAAACKVWRPGMGNGEATTILTNNRCK